MQRNHLALKSAVVALGLAFGAHLSLRAQTFTPIALAPSSFTQEIVVPTNWTYKANAQSISVTIDHGPSLQAINVAGFPSYYSLMSGDTFFEVGLDRTSATASNSWGLPKGGSFLTNTTATSHVYQLPYWTNWNSNCICLGPYTNGATYNGQSLTGGAYVGQNYFNVPLTLNNTANYTALSFLCTGGGPYSNTVSITYADGSVQSGVVFAVPNWFVNSPTYQMGPNVPTAAYAYSAQARCNPAENQNNINITSTTSGNRLWSVDIALSNSNSPPVMLTFNPLYSQNTAGTISAEDIFAVSGSVNPNDNQNLPNTSLLAGPFSPIAISGFNAGCVVANSPANLAGFAPVTATMDDGTNLGNANNTFFEKGWDLSALTNGFPVRGTLLTSGAFTNRTYQMPASYNQPMCTLIDTNHQSNNIVPVNTNIAYTAFSLLTAGGTIGSGKQMTNYIILQHADGLNESNIFIGYDWFETTVPPAYVANERINIGTGTSTNGRQVENLNSGSPKLFDSEFPMMDGTPVTNIVVGFRQAPAAAATTYVIAVSATTNFIPPVAPAVYTAAQNVYPGQTAVFSFTPGVGTLPTYQWQATDNSTFTNNVNNGPTGSGSIISGATTTSLTIANVSASDIKYYTCLISNLAGGASSTPAPLTLLTSTSPLMVLPGDPISDFYGNGYTPGEAYPTPVGLGTINAIDGTTSAYLNYGASGTTAGFVGPVGIIVSPSQGSAVINALRFYVAVNAAICDPADFSLDGSDDGVNWTNVVPDMALALPNVRNLATGLTINSNNQVLQEVDFPNTTSYSSYRLTVQNVKNNAPGVTANSMQIGEIQFLGSLGHIAPGIVQQPFPASTPLLPGKSVTWHFLVNGPGPVTYQWYQGSLSNPLIGQTNNSLTISGVSSGAGGYFCVAANPYGSASSTSVGYTVLPAATNNYVNTILADGPVAFLPLNEGPNNGSGNNGAIAYDLVGGHDGIYSNTVLQANPPGSYSTNDPGDAFAEFGQITDATIGSNIDNYVAGISNINFATPTNSSTNFSVEAWVYLNSDTLAGAAVAAQGPGGDEQWALDMGGTGAAFRFYFRNASNGGSTTVSGNVAPSNSIWYHVVAVLNETSNVEDLYLNGALVATNSVPGNYGVLSTNTPITIGARKSTSGGAYNLQLNGVVANFAIYPYALSAAQVASHFGATLMSPGILTQPSPLTQNLQEGGTYTWKIVAYGPGPLTYQWYSIVNGVTSPITGATNASYSLTPTDTASAGQNGYFCTVNNPNGSTSSETATANVVAPTSPYVSAVLGDHPIAFFRLDEGPDNGSGNDGVIAYDSVGGHNGFYTNVYLDSPGYYNLYGDPDNVAAQFGLWRDNTISGSPIQDNYVGGINGISFASPTNTDTNFTVEAWVYLAGNSLSSAGIVAMGTGGGGEEFALDMGGGTGNPFRFYFRTAGGNSPTSASSTVAPNLDEWYHVVGVLNESNNVIHEYLYTNGVQAAATTVTDANPPGVQAGNLPMSIGSRTSSATTNYNDQLNGEVANVAIYPYALTAAQVQNHYLATGIAPILTTLPQNVTAVQGQPAVFNAVAFGTPTLVYQWFVNGSGPLTDGPLSAYQGGSTATVSGSSTGSLTISGVSFAGDNGEQYAVQVNNSYGTSPQASAYLTVTAAPAIGTDLPANIVAVAGLPFSLTATFSGSQPISYQWLYNNNPLSAGPGISGVATNTLLINPAVAGTAGTYQLVAYNSYGTNRSTAASVTVGPYLTFNGAGGDWSALGSAGAGYTAANTLELTDGGLDEVRGSFFEDPVYVGGFQASYTYTDVNGRGYHNDADGACFVVQNDARGPAALGGDGSSLGYNTVSNSVALQINLYNGFGIFFSQDGAIVVQPAFDSDLNFASGDPFNINVTYAGGVATVFVQDTVNNDTFNMSTNINLPSVIGTNIAYVGFTGSDGGTGATQTITNFKFISLVDVSAQASGANIILAWPGAGVSGIYQLQQNSNLACPGCWTDVPNAPSVVGGQYQVSLPQPAGPMFYRLVLQ